MKRPEDRDGPHGDGDGERGEAERLIARLDDLGADRPARVAAARRLGELGGGGAVRALVRRLDDDRLSDNARDALSAIGVPALPALREALADRGHPAATRAVAAYLLLKLGDPGAPGRMAASLLDPDEDLRVRATIVEGLGRFGHGEGAMALAGVLGAPDPELRRRAILALERVGGGRRSWPPSTSGRPGTATRGTASWRGARATGSASGTGSRWLTPTTRTGRWRCRRAACTSIAST